MLYCKLQYACSFLLLTTSRSNSGEQPRPPKLSLPPLSGQHPAFSIRCAQGAKSPIKPHADGGSTHTRRRWKVPHVDLRHSCFLPKSYEMHLLLPPPLACRTSNLFRFLSSCIFFFFQSLPLPFLFLSLLLLEGLIVPSGTAIEIINSVYLLIVINPTSIWISNFSVAYTP